jgi:3-methyl-2-oxobutanoate hydroxymethyltransferase
MAGLTPNVGRFVRRYGDVAGVLRGAAQTFAAEVSGAVFPGPENVYR